MRSPFDLQHHAREDLTLSQPWTTPYVAGADHAPLAVHFDGRELAVGTLGSSPRNCWTVQAVGSTISLTPAAELPSVDEQYLLSILEAIFSRSSCDATLTLDENAPAVQGLINKGLLSVRDNNTIKAAPDALWQEARIWLAKSDSPFPLQYVLTEGRRHPRRKPKPKGMVYRRHIPWLNQALSLRTVNLHEDLHAFNKWMNDPAVAQFWQEQGDLGEHEDYLRRIEADPHVIGLIGCLDTRPFSYFEVYWAKEDRIAPFFNVEDYDRGWHVLVGEPEYRGQAYLTAWLPSISHYMFLDDCRTQRVVAEPRADNLRMIKNLSRNGYALVKEFDFPHKRAIFCSLSRERFFGEALWIPGGTGPSR